MIEAITFDFWDTLAIDDSDEPKRAALGLPSKIDARTQLFVRKIQERYPHLSEARIAEAYAAANERFRHAWHTEQRTPGVTTRLYDAYEHLGLQPKPGDYARLIREIDELVREIETMEIRIPPDFAAGVHTVLPLLAQEYKLGIISDAIHTHGRGLRHLLDQQGLLPYFSYFIFSDEIRLAKPTVDIFRQAALGLNTSPARMVHVGDRERNDVAGPLAAGMNAILFTGIIDRGSTKTHATAVCRHFADLPPIIRRLSAS
ncbi:MAG: HAD family hydrolase [Chloroflexota bacterium]|nr:HAD family hydrolase [Chloroflexota bacterium]